MTSLDHPAISKISAALHEAGSAAAADGIRILTDDVRTAAAAAAALGVPVGAIANSLVFRATEGDQEFPLLALTSGAHRADTSVLAALTGAARVGRADPAFVREHTGQAIGGVAPMGHPRPVRTLVDRALARYEVVWAAAGHPKAVFPTTFDELVSLTGGVRSAGGCTLTAVIAVVASAPVSCPGTPPTSTTVRGEPSSRATTRWRSSVSIGVK